MLHLRAGFTPTQAIRPVCPLHADALRRLPSLTTPQESGNPRPKILSSPRIPPIPRKGARLAAVFSHSRLSDQARIEKGNLMRPTAPGLGVTLTRQMEAEYPFDETAVYSCLLNDWGPPPDDYWKSLPEP